MTIGKGNIAAISAVLASYGTAYAQGLEASGDSSIIPDWFRFDVFGVEAWRIAGVLVLLVLSLVIQKIVAYAFRNQLKSLAGKMKNRWVEKVVQKSDGPIGGLVMAAVFMFGIPVLGLPPAISDIAVFAIRVFLAFSVMWLGYRLVDVLADYLSGKAELTDTKMDDQLVPLLRKSIKVLIVIVGGLMILQNLDVDIGSLLAGLGLGGLAFALAAKDTIANLFGSLMIFVDRPFQIGDWIVMGSDVEGTVEEVGFRTTRVRTFYNSLITMPNARLVDTPVDNMGMRRYRRYSTTLGLTYDTPAEKVQAFCEGVRAIIQSLPGMRKDFYMVEFEGFGANSLDIMLYCFMDVPDWPSELRERTNINLEILRFAEELGVEFAFPTQTLHVDSFPGEEKTNVKEEGKVDTPGMKNVISAFGPGGSKAMPKGFTITHGYDPGKRESGNVSDEN